MGRAAQKFRTLHDDCPASEGHSHDSEQGSVFHPSDEENSDDEELADDVEEPRSEPTASSIAPEGTSDADLNHKGADANSVKPEVVLVDSSPSVEKTATYQPALLPGPIVSAADEAAAVTSRSATPLAEAQTYKMTPPPTSPRKHTQLGTFQHEHDEETHTSSHTKQT